MTDPAKRPAPPTPHISTPSSLPRVTITYCIKCKWMFRATYVRNPIPSLPLPLFPDFNLVRTGAPLDI